MRGAGHESSLRDDRRFLQQRDVDLDAELFLPMTWPEAFVRVFELHGEDICFAAVLIAMFLAAALSNR